MPAVDTLDPEERPVSKSHLGFPVVGIGASAGGLSALQRLFGKLPSDPGMAFVIVMHLSPDHESSLGAILQRAGKMPVIAVVGPTPIEANHVYVISPAMKLTMDDGHLRVFPMVSLEGRRQSIDIFFRSLAQAHQERAVCIVLSGTGADGSQGLKRVKELGGIALAQSPEDAEFDAMPRAAAQTGLVDFVLPADEIPDKLLRLWQNAMQIALPDPPPDLIVEPETGDEEMLAEEALVSIKALLRERTGHDFSHYKRGTVLRRLERRMQVNAVPDLASYRRVLDAEPKETPALLQDMLISVTNFFRDPEAFEALTSVLAASIAERPKGEVFRAWVAGCATGEEAYSIAILLRELLGASGPAIQVFASDIDERAVASGRTGFFPGSIATDVSPARLREFFVQEAGGFRIVKSVRDGIVFSAHNVLSDPPFTRMDLICCRNLLIYLDRAAQAQLLNGFHFALRSRGLLFLGGSETCDAAGGVFDVVNKAHRIYRASPRAIKSRLFPPMPIKGSRSLLGPSLEIRAPAATPPLEALHERVLRIYAPPTVLVDADDTVLHVSERASHLLRLPEGAPTNKLLELARPELRAELRAALIHAAKTRRIVEAPRVRLTVNGEARMVIMTVRPATGENPPGLMLVVFDEAEESMAVAPGNTPLRDPVVESLESELLRTQARLRSTVDESSASTEELRASNEELQTINEELRSTTEELETSREELQAVNEELTTVNAELTLRIDETGKANDDLQNLMTSADIGAVFVDRDMRLKRFTPQASTFFNVLASDAGRPLLHITHRLDYPQLADDVAVVLRDLKRVEREVRAEDGRWFLARCVPYRTSEDRIEGAVLAFFDVSALRVAQNELRLSEQRMRLVAESMADYAILTIDEQGKIATWSVGAEKIFGYSAAEAIGQPFALIFTEEDRLADAHGEELRKARQSGRAADDRWHARKDGVRIFCSGIVSPLADGRGFAKIARDFTRDELLQRSREAELASERATSGRLQEAGAMKDEFLAIVSHELKNPLSIILMNATLLSRLPSSAADPRATRSTAVITAAVASQAQLINDLLELSRANMGKVALAPVLLEMSELVHQVVDAVAPDAAAKGQLLDVELASASVRADPVRVEQIVWNLVGNAIKFTPQGGAVRVALAVDGSMARLSVTDSGIGIAPEHLADIFEMFRQVDSRASRKQAGLGIGLALVKQLAELHGGRVEAASEGLGQGATFSVWLPLAEGEVPGRRPSEPVEGLGSLSLLLVDDEPQLLEAFGELLESEGCRVTLAGSAESALELAHAERFDALISDIAMPGRDGHWLATQLRASDQTREMPLVAVSGMSRGVDRARALKAGFDAHVAKPLNIEELREEIFSALGARGASGREPR